MKRSFMNVPLMKRALRSGAPLVVLMLSMCWMHASVCQRNISVSSNAQLASAVSGALAGDCISLANGSYGGFTLTHSGTADSPIIIQAANRGGATITSGVVRLSQTSFVTISGVNITTSGASETIDGETIAVAVWFEAAQHSRFTRAKVLLSGQAANTSWVLLSGNSDFNEIDHNEFGPNSVGGSHYVWPRGRRTIDGVTPPADRTPWALGQGPVNPNMARHTLIDHNYFHDKAVASGETILLGALGVTGDYQDTFSTVENNLFVNCDGDPEVISVKSSSNTIRYNTVVTSGGVLSARSGNKNSLYGNFVLGGGKAGSGGVKLNERDHVVYNNYIENVDQYPIMLENGDPYSSSSFAHAQVVNAHIVYNTVINPKRQVLIGHSSRTLPPSGTVFANNVIDGAGTLFTDSGSSGSVYRQNIIFPFDPGTAGFSVTDPRLTAVNGIQKLASGSPAIGFADATLFPLVVDDMDGQPRDSNPDAGADEFSAAPVTRQPLTTADVGPNAASNCLVHAADGVWSNSAMSGANSGTFTSQFDVTPSVSPISAAVGLSQGTQTAFSGFANLVIFTTSGTIQARNGGSYAAASTIPFSAGVSYHFRLAVNVPAHTYSIFITPSGGTEQTVGSNFAFRTEQNAVSSLDTWGALVNSSPGGTITVCNFSSQ